MKAAVETACPEVTAIANIKDNSIAPHLASSNFSKIPYLKNSFPRIGSFEVYFRGKVVYSKLNKGRWPSALTIANQIRNILDGIVLITSNPIQENYKRTGTYVFRSSSAKNIKLRKNKSETRNKKQFMKTTSQALMVESKDTEVKDQDMNVRTTENYVKNNFFFDPTNEKEATDGCVKENETPLLPAIQKTSSALFEESKSKEPEKNFLAPGSQVSPTSEMFKTLEASFPTHEPPETTAKVPEGSNPSIDIERFKEFPVTKSYTISLEQGAEVFKRIPILNDTDAAMDIQAEVSDPDAVKLSNPQFAVPAKSKGLLKFQCITTTKANKKVYILVQTNNIVTDCYELVLEYV